MQNNMYIKEIKYNKEKVIDKEKYPFNIEVLKNLKEIKIKKPVTFLIGENGTGKSTLIEAIAIACNLNPEGGTQNFLFSTKNTHSELYKYLTINKTGVPQTKFFLRAESFYNVSTEITRLNEENGYSTIYNYYGGNLHECSHGKSFIKLVQNRFSENGLYILDEPEAALSPSRQMTLLALINDLVKKGSQFIIATHSPILIAYKNGIIIDLDNNLKEINYENTEIYKTYKMFLERHDTIQEYLFND